MLKQAYIVDFNLPQQQPSVKVKHALLLSALQAFT